MFTDSYPQPCSPSSRPDCNEPPPGLNPRLRRFAPYLGLTLYNLYEVVCRTNPITGQVVKSRCKNHCAIVVESREKSMQKESMQKKETMPTTRRMSSLETYLSLPWVGEGLREGPSGTMRGRRCFYSCISFTALPDGSFMFLNAASQARASAVEQATLGTLGTERAALSEGKCSAKIER